MSDYFSEFKKGEVSELFEALRTASAERNAQKELFAVQRVVAYMTLGVDVSRLFSAMVMASNTDNVVQKKLVYLFLCNHAERNPDLAMMVINTLHRDCGNANPVVRGLALRSLCALRVPSLVDHMFRQLRMALGDASAYVRKTAVVAAAKLHRMVPAMVLESGIVSKLYEMIKDRDATVTVNCILALDDILRAEGGMSVTRPIIQHLFARFREFNDWAQCVVLGLVERLELSEDECYDVLSRLDDRLQHANSAVVFAAARVFLRIADWVPHLERQVYERLKTPLLTAAAAVGPVELTYQALKHIEQLVARAPGLFDDAYKLFMARHHEPTYVKTLKVTLFRDIVNESNMADVLAELAEYATDVNAAVARTAVRTIGHIAMRVPAAAPDGVARLLTFLDMEAAAVVPETMLVVKDLVRRYPEQASAVVPRLRSLLNSVQEPEARAVVVWLLGEYGTQSDEAPYQLETLVDQWNELLPPVRLQLLSAALRLFFARPPECQRSLGKLFSLAIADVSHIDVHDRALFLYRLLVADREACRDIVCAAKEPTFAFAEDEVQFSVRDSVFAEFNSLSVVYGKPYDAWHKPCSLGSSDATPAAAAAAATAAAGDAPTPTGGAIATGGDALGGPPQPSSSSSPSPAPPSSASLVAGVSAFAADPAYQCDPQQFQHLWSTLPAAAPQNAPLPHARAQSTYERGLADAGIRVVASGTTPDGAIKIYACARDRSSGVEFLAELVVATQSPAVSLTVRTAHPEAATGFLGALERVLLA